MATPAENMQVPEQPCPAQIPLPESPSTASVTTFESSSTASTTKTASCYAQETVRYAGFETAPSFVSSSVSSVHTAVTSALWRCLGSVYQAVSCGDSCCLSSNEDIDHGRLGRLKDNRPNAFQQYYWPAQYSNEKMAYGNGRGAQNSSNRKDSRKSNKSVNSASNGNAWPSERRHVYMPTHAASSFLSTSTNLHMMKPESLVSI